MDTVPFPAKVSTLSPSVMQMPLMRLSRVDEVSDPDPRRRHRRAGRDGRDARTPCAGNRQRQRAIHRQRLVVADDACLKVEGVPQPIIQRTRDFQLVRVADGFQADGGGLAVALQRVHGHAPGVGVAGVFIEDDLHPLPVQGVQYFGIQRIPAVPRVNDDELRREIPCLIAHAPGQRFGQVKRAVQPRHIHIVCAHLRRCDGRARFRQQAPIAVGVLAAQRYPVNHAFRPLRSAIRPRRLSILPAVAPTSTPVSSTICC